MAHVHGNYTTIYGGGKPSCVAINVHSKYSYMVEGELSRVGHVWQLMCTVVTRIWWRGPLTCGQLMCNAN